jgi:hypothetical protein
LGVPVMIYANGEFWMNAQEWWYALLKRSSEARKLVELVISLFVSDQTFAFDRVSACSQVSSASSVCLLWNLQRFNLFFSALARDNGSGDEVNLFDWFGDA